MAFKMITFLLIFTLVYMAESASFRTEPYEHPDHPGQCYDKETNEAIPVGESRSNSKLCKRQECQPDFSFLGSTCAPVGSPEGCKVTDPDFSQEYPKCCPQLICN